MSFTAHKTRRSVVRSRAVGKRKGGINEEEIASRTSQTGR